MLVVYLRHLRQNYLLTLYAVHRWTDILTSVACKHIHTGPGEFQGKSFWCQCTWISHLPCSARCSTIFLMLLGRRCALWARRGRWWDCRPLSFALDWDLLSGGGNQPPCARKWLSDPWGCSWSGRGPKQILSLCLSSLSYYRLGPCCPILFPSPSSIFPLWLDLSLVSDSWLSIHLWLGGWLGHKGAQCRWLLHLESPRSVSMWGQTLRCHSWPHMKMQWGLLGLHLKQGSRRFRCFLSISRSRDSRS